MPETSPTPDRLTIAVAQLDGRIYPEDNIESVGDMIAQAAKLGADLVSFPETSNSVCRLGGEEQEKRPKFYPEQTDPFVVTVQNLSKQHQIWVHLGSVLVQAEPSSDNSQEPQKLKNRSILFDSRGQCVARYDKIHLFDAAPGDGVSYQESKMILAGSEAVVAKTPWGRFGLTICYDLRFPELFLRSALAQANVIFVPAAFTEYSGRRMVWHTLLRARAIETGCFIVAAAQHGNFDPKFPGKHENGRSTYGHSLIVNPHGDVIAERPAGPGILLAELNLEEVALARQKIPSLQNRQTQFLDLPLTVQGA